MRKGRGSLLSLMRFLYFLYEYSVILSLFVELLLPAHTFQENLFIFIPKSKVKGLRGYMYNDIKARWETAKKHSRVNTRIKTGCYPYITKSFLLLPSPITIRKWSSFLLMLRVPMEVQGVGFHLSLCPQYVGCPTGCYYLTRRHSLLGSQICFIASQLQCIYFTHCSIRWQSLLTEIHFYLRTKLLYLETTFQVQLLENYTKQTAFKGRSNYICTIPTVWCIS